MLSFENDYSQGAHEKILQRLIETNMDAQVGYGFDEYTESAKEKIRQACGCPDAEVYFLVGGTQTNQVVIDTLLEDYEGVISGTRPVRLNFQDIRCLLFRDMKANWMPVR